MGLQMAQRLLHLFNWHHHNVVTFRVLVRILSQFLGLGCLAAGTTRLPWLLIQAILPRELLIVFGSLFAHLRFHCLAVCLLRSHVLLLELIRNGESLVSGQRPFDGECLACHRPLLHPTEERRLALGLFLRERFLPVRPSFLCPLRERQLHPTTTM